MGDNYDTALKAEAKKVIRCLHHYTADQRANHAASFRLGHSQREAIGEYFYTHPNVPGRAFSTKGAAARAGLSATEQLEAGL